jgi:hypothetical protein
MKSIIKQTLEASIIAATVVLFFLLASGTQDIKTQLIVFLAAFVPSFLSTGLLFKKKFKSLCQFCSTSRMQRTRR